MKQAPDWLPAFPFLHTHWDSICQLNQTVGSIEDFCLSQDWQAFLAWRQQNSPVLDWFALLREYRQTRLAFLAYHDLEQPIDKHVDTMQVVSDLADLMVRVAFQAAQNEMREKHGVVINEAGKQVSLLIYALGKLGTQELNYSSDIDLVMLYSTAGCSDGERPLEAASYFTRMGQKIIKLLDHYTAGGRVYRVDMRLRPFGSAGPLACNFSSLHQYLLLEGREWERFAWMRARLVVGPDAEHSVVMHKITPFIYRKHLDYTVFKALAKIKTEIANHLTFAAEDLKQGWGGIRAVEFIVQSLQLVFGGRHHSFQGTSIHHQLQVIIQAEKLPAEQGKALELGWLWLRKVENICQLVEDNDTHIIPDDKQVKQVISEALGTASIPEFNQQFSAHRANVAELFDCLFEQAQTAQDLTPADLQWVQDLLSELPLRRLPQDRIDQVEQLLNLAIGDAGQQPSVTVMKHFILLIKQILTRPSYIMLLIQEKYVLHKLLDMLSQHNYFVTTLQTYPVLLEQLFDAQTFKLTGAAALRDVWQQRAPVNDVEEWMENIRCFKLEHQFNAIKAWSDGDVTAQQTAWQLTQLAVCILQAVVTYSWREIKTKLPEGELQSHDLVVLAYGSAATSQMTIHSDLDLVFLLAVDALSADDRVFAQKWVKRVVHHLTSNLYHGHLYALDMQLRPNGNSGSLVTTQAEFERYQLHDAWVWEHAALIKSKALVAAHVHEKWFEAVRFDVLSQQRDPQTVDQAMSDMAQKIQQVSNDNDHACEFDVLAAVLKHAHEYPGLLESSDMAGVVKQLLAHGMLAPDRNYLGAKKDPTV